MKFNHKINLIGLIAILFMGMAIIPAPKMGSEQSLLKVGDSFPDIKFEGSLTALDRNYLGLSDSSIFLLNDIQANLIFVEFLNKFCTHCQQQARILNELFEDIQRDSSLRTQVKMLGVGMGNSLYQMQTYRAEKEIPFPLVPDPNFIIHEALGQPKAPFIVIFKKTADGKGIVSATFLGLVASKDQLLNALTTLLQSNVDTIAETDVQKVVLRTETPTAGLTEADFEKLVKDHLKHQGYRILKFERVLLADQEVLFKAQLKLKGKKSVIFIREIYRNTVCDICHDTHFWYSFDSNGTIIHFTPIYLPKSYNKEWAEKDVQKFRQRLENHSIAESFEFKPEVDAVTSATITSSLIFDTINKTKHLFNKLKEEGIIKDVR
ncbi:MAG TPA: redoxin domain-containing protein [bacterium]